MAEASAKNATNDCSASRTATDNAQLAMEEEDEAEARLGRATNNDTLATLTTEYQRLNKLSVETCETADFLTTEAATERTQAVDKAAVCSKLDSDDESQRKKEA